MKADVENIPAPVQGPGVFDNGFVLPQIGRGGGSGKTWNWGYEDNSQIVGDQLLMQRLRGLPEIPSFTGEDDPALGGEVVLGAELLRFEVGNRFLRWGAEIGYGYNSFSVDNSARLTSRTSLTNFLFNLDGVIPPRAPYAGTFEGPGPVIDRFASATNVFTSSSQGDFTQEIESDLHLFKIGVWFEYPVARRLNAALSFGYASLYADTQFTFSEQITFANPAIPDMPRTTKTVGGRSWQPGAYAQLRLHYNFHRHLGAYVGGDFQYNEDLEFEGEGRKITMEFNSQFAATAGVIVRF